MCFGSKTKEVKAPPPTPPTTFDYSKADRAPQDAMLRANAAAASAADDQPKSFGAELGAS
jgi:hypothetical protein